MRKEKKNFLPHSYFNKSLFRWRQSLFVPVRNEKYIMLGFCVHSQRKRQRISFITLQGASNALLIKKNLFHHLISWLEVVLGMRSARTPKYSYLFAIHHPNYSIFQRTQWSRSCGYKGKRKHRSFGKAFNEIFLSTTYFSTWHKLFFISHDGFALQFFRLYWFYDY